MGIESIAPWKDSDSYLTDFFAARKALRQRYGPNRKPNVASPLCSLRSPTTSSYGGDRRGASVSEANRENTFYETILEVVDIASAEISESDKHKLATLVEESLLVCNF